MPRGPIRSVVVDWVATKRVTAPSPKHHRLGRWIPRRHGLSRTRSEPHVAMAVVHGYVSHDARVQREAAALAMAGYRVTVLSLPGGEVPDLGSPYPRAVIPAAMESSSARLREPVCDTWLHLFRRWTARLGHRGNVSPI